jgi:hypothetical protein
MQQVHQHQKAPQLEESGEQVLFDAMERAAVVATVVEQDLEVLANLGFDGLDLWTAFSAVFMLAIHGADS